MSDNVGKKDDDGKARMGLLPWAAVMAVVEVLHFGAKKYTSRERFPSNGKLERKLVESCTCVRTSSQPPVTPSEGTQRKDSVSLATSRSTPRPSERPAIQIGSSSTESQGTSVVSATTPSSKRGIPSTLENSARTTTDGSETIRTENESRPGLVGGGVASEVENVGEIGDASLLSRSSDSPGKTMFDSPQRREVDAPSVERNLSGHVSTSTTAIEPGSSADSSADDATRDSVSWETLRRALNEHSPTCAVQKLGVRVADDGAAYEVVRSGAGNWRSVRGWKERFSSAAMRHLIAYQSGEQLDIGPGGSGLPHTAHAATNCLFVLALSLATDDHAYETIEEQKARGS